MKPLKDWNVGRGYRHGSPTFYSSFHLGVDYMTPTGTKILAPFDGEIVLSKYLPQGGNTVWFKPNNQSVIIRFLHLSERLAVGKYSEGELLGLTGNSGSRTRGSHLHLDISKDKVIISNYKNFIDPDKFNWGTKSKEENMYNIKSVLKNEIEKITGDDYGKVMAENEQIRAAKDLKEYRKECEEMDVDGELITEIEELRVKNSKLENENNILRGEKGVLVDKNKRGLEAEGLLTLLSSAIKKLIQWK